VSSRTCGITFSTAGTFLKVFQGNPLLTDYSHVVIDEIHERGLVVDTLLLLLRDCRRWRPDLRLVLMSASLDVNDFQSFFSEHRVPIISIPDSSHPVQDFFLEDLVREPENDANDLVGAAESLIATIHNAMEPGAIAGVG